MIVTCPKCKRNYDDTPNWTICPHNPLDIHPDAKYCRKHDLFNCYLCPTNDPLPTPSQEAFERESKLIREQEFTDGL